MSRKRRRRRVGRLFLLTVLLLSAGIGGWVYLTEVYPSSPGPGSGTEVFVDIPWGSGAGAVAHQAVKAGVVRGERRFTWYLRLSGQVLLLKAGRHQVRDDWSPEKIARAFTKPGTTADVRVTLREGRSRFEFAQELESKGITSQEAFLDATVDGSLLKSLDIIGDTAEGYLFPETYRFALATPGTEVVTRLVVTFRERADAVIKGHHDDLELLGREMLELEKNLGHGPFEALGGADLEPAAIGRHVIVILASMVEAETPLAEERPQVAAVLLNRLRFPEFHWRKLQIDPTVSYGCRAEPKRAPSCNEDFTRLTTSHLADPENRYNTYIHPGLPPGPIGNPSLQSIHSVLSPANVDYLYFVANGRGGHVFSSTLDEHNKAVARYRAIRLRHTESSAQDGGPETVDGG